MLHIFRIQNVGQSFPYVHFALSSPIKVSGLALFTKNYTFLDTKKIDLYRPDIYLT